MGNLAHAGSRREPIEAATLERVLAEAAGAAAGADDAATVIGRALDILHEGLGEAGASAFVLEHGRLWSVGVRGYSAPPFGLTLDEGIVGRAARTCSVQMIVDVKSDPDFVPVLGDTVSELAVPIVIDGGLVGIVNIETRRRLPAGCDSDVASLAAALAAPLVELRASRNIGLSALARLFVYMSSLRDPGAIAEIAVGALARALPLETSQLLLLDESGDLVETATWSSGGDGVEPLSGDVLQDLRGLLEESAVIELLDAGKVQVPGLAGSRVRSVVIVPLRASGEEFGLLVGASRFATGFDHGQGELAALLAAHTAASLDAALALGRERRSAHTDSLTGLLNRRGIEERLELALAETQDDRQPLSVVVLDCDDFKDVNDRAGHEVGDALLREIGILLETACPPGGSAARLGGDEFLVLLPGADSDAALAAAERVRETLDVGLDLAGFPVRLSAGISTYPYDGASARQLLRAADQALYRAKTTGKDRAIGFRELVRSARVEAPTGVPSERDRPGRRQADSAVVDAIAASEAMWAVTTVEAVLERLCKSVTFVVGATGTLVSRVEGPRLADMVRHSIRDIDLGEDTAYLISDFPVTQEVLEAMSPRSISFLDDDLDRAEAFVLRELRMNCALLVPLVVHGRAWGLVEAYDMRMRRFAREDEAVARFLVSQAGRRLESLGAATGGKRRLPLFRLPL